MFTKTSIRNIFAIVCMLICSMALQAQQKPGTYIKASIGYGISSPYRDYEIQGTGFYAQGEYIYAVKTWFSLRPYLGVIFTNKSENEFEDTNPEYQVTTSAVMLGGKFRVAAPIPYVAPYLETGLGVGIGSFKNYNPIREFDKSGALFHIPFTLGVALGKNHNIEVEFTYYFYNKAQLVNGAAAIGLTFPL